MIIEVVGCLGRRVAASRVRLRYYEREGIVTEFKTPLDERALDRLTLASDAAVVAYQELKVQAARKVRENRQRADFARTQSSGDDEIA